MISRLFSFSLTLVIKFSSFSASFLLLSLWKTLPQKSSSMKTCFLAVISHLASASSKVSAHMNHSKSSMSKKSMANI